MSSSSTMLHLLVLAAVTLALALEVNAASGGWNTNQEREPVYDLTGDFPERQLDGRELTDIEVPAQILAKRNTQVRLCGQQLVNAIRMACLLNKSQSKRSANNQADPQSELSAGLAAADGRRPYLSTFFSRFPVEDAAAEEEQIELNLLGHPLEHPAASSFGRFKTVTFLQGLRKRSGAAHSCCAKPCTIAHLSTYC